MKEIRSIIGMYRVIFYSFNNFKKNYGNNPVSAELVGFFKLRDYIGSSSRAFTSGLSSRAFMLGF